MGQKPSSTKVNPKEKVDANSKSKSKKKMSVPVPTLPKPPPRPPRRPSQTNVVLGSSNKVDRSFFLQQYTPPPKKSKKNKKKKKTNHFLAGTDPNQPETESPKPPPKKYTCNGITPEINFGTSKKYATSPFAINLPGNEPGIGGKHGFICFADDAFWFVHNEKEKFNSSYVNGKKVKDSGLKRTGLDGHSHTIPRSSVRLHDEDILIFGSTKTIQMKFTHADYQSKYWLEYDKFIGGERPKPDREWLKSLGCKVQGLSAKKGALAVIGGFKVKKMKEVHDSEMKLRLLEEKKIKEKLRKQKLHVMQLRKQMKKDYLKVKDANVLIDDLLKNRKLKTEEVAAIEKKKKEEEEERIRIENELKEQQRILREAEEVKKNIVAFCLFF